MDYANVLYKVLELTVWWKIF